MRIGIISVYVHRGRTGKQAGGVVQSAVGPLIAGLLPREHEIDIIDETCNSIDWNVAYDLLFLTSFHSDFDRARQIAHYWRRRGAKTVYGGRLASTYPDLCQPYFDAVVIGDAEGIIPTIWDDFQRGELAPRYVAPYYDPEKTSIGRYDLVARKRLLPLEFEITRGCPFSCGFCMLTAIGTRFQMRPTEHVVHEIHEAWSQLARAPFWKRRIVGFYDNNIGGNLTYLRKLCKALAPLHIRWSSSLTFNVLEADGMLDALVEAGCVSIFVGLESFNPATIRDMRKFQNRIERISAVIQACLKHGIVLSSGMVICSDVDTLDYMRQLPRYLRESGLYMPHFLSFEAPFPGTPKFIRLANSPEATFLPGALLRDFDAYTLVVRPREGTPEEYAQTYRELKREIAGWSTRRQKLLHDVPRLLSAGAWSALGVDLFNILTTDWRDHPNRTFIAGTDLEPPEMRAIPFTDNDFQSPEERDAILTSWRVTDEQGRVLPMWRTHQPLFVGTLKRQSP